MLMSRVIDVDSLLDNTFQSPSKEEYDELEENDKKRTGLNSDMTMSQGRRHNDGRNGIMNIKDNILPYDQTRVKLKTPINGFDYINASWIYKVKEHNVYDDVYAFLSATKINFILTQDPTKDTEKHFYQMIFEQQVDIVVHIYSDNKVPKWKKKTHGNITRELVERIKLENNIVRETIEIVFAQQKRTVNKHRSMVYHFSAWPTDDQFKDDDSNNLLTLISLVQRDIDKESGTFTIAAHDPSGGVEGASSFITLFQMVQELDTKLKVRSAELQDISRQGEMHFINLFDKVNELRKERAHMVSTYANYRFLLSTLAYYAKNKTKFDEIFLMARSVSNENETVSNRSRPMEVEVNHENDDGITVDEIPYVLSQHDRVQIQAIQDSRVYFPSDV